MIELPKKARPSVIVKNADITRPVYCRAMLTTYKDRRYVIVTDSFVAVAVAAKVTAEEKDGTIPLPVLQLIETGKFAGRQLDDGSWLHHDHGYTEARYSWQDKQPFPDLERLGLFDTDKEYDGQLDAIGINPTFLENVRKAMGCPGVKLMFKSELRAYGVRPLHDADNASRAIVMPVRLTV